MLLGGPDLRVWHLVAADGPVLAEWIDGTFSNINMQQPDQTADAATVSLTETSGNALLKLSTVSAVGNFVGTSCRKRCSTVPKHVQIRIKIMALCLWHTV